MIQDNTSTQASGKPIFPRFLFWEFKLEDIDWDDDYVLVIERVIERGSRDEWQELFRYYGYEKVLETLKVETAYLMDHTIEKVCVYFGLKPEELRCYRRKQSMPRHWL